MSQKKASRKKSAQGKTGKKGTKGKKKSACICISAGGFEEHLPMHEWKRVMDSVRRCPVHGQNA